MRPAIPLFFMVLAAHLTPFAQDAPSSRLAGYVIKRIDPPNAVYSVASDINDAGHIVGYAEIDKFDGVAHGFEYDGTSYTMIDYPGAFATYLMGINNLEESVGFYYDAAGGTHPFLLNPDGSFEDLSLPIQYSFVNPYKINDTLQIVGTFADTNGNVHGFNLQGDTFQQLDYRDYSTTTAMGINNTGQIVGDTWASGSGPFYSYVYSNGAFKLVHVPGAIATETIGINNKGEVCGDFARNNDRHGFVYSRGKMVAFNIFGSHSTQAFSLNDSHQVVGTYMDNSDVFHGFLAQPAGNK